jgi:hypothetical protein
MFAWPRRLVVSSLIVSSFAFACSTKHVSVEQAPPAPGPEGFSMPDAAADEPAIEPAYCERFCARAVACDPAVDEDTCSASCENDNGAFLSKVRAEFTTEISRCIDATACKEIESGAGTSSCVDEAQARVSVTSATTDFCESYAVSAKKCGMQLDKAACIDEVKIYSDSAVAQMTTCLGKACADIRPCVTAASGGKSAAAGTSTPACSVKLGYTATCKTCMSASCCAEDNACAYDASCLAWVNCAAACPSSSAATCVATCDASYPSGRTRFDTLSACRTAHCATSCAS